MILESFEYAEADIEARQVIEARNEAETVLQCNGKGPARRTIRELSAEEQSRNHRGRRPSARSREERQIITRSARPSNA